MSFINKFAVVLVCIPIAFQGVSSFAQKNDENVMMYPILDTSSRTLNLAENTRTLYPVLDTTLDSAKPSNPQADTGNLLVRYEWYESNPDVKYNKSALISFVNNMIDATNIKKVVLKLTLSDVSPKSPTYISAYKPGGKFDSNITFGNADGYSVDAVPTGKVSDDIVRIDYNTPADEFIELDVTEYVKECIRNGEKIDFQIFASYTQSTKTPVVSFYDMTAEEDKRPQLVIESEESSTVPTPPEAFNVVVNGIAKVGETVEGQYRYQDVNGDREATSTYKWYIADTEGGTYREIEGATSKTYTITNDDTGKYIKFEVTPVSEGTEQTIGISVKSEPVYVMQPQSPIAENVKINGIVKVGNELTGLYDFNDADGDKEEESEYKWYISDTEFGDYKLIDGETEKKYVVKQSDETKYIKFSVTPKDNSQINNIGEETFSEPVLVPKTVGLAAIEDTYVRGGSSESLIFGKDRTLILKGNPANGIPGEWDRLGLLKFDVNSVADKIDDINSISLSLNIEDFIDSKIRVYEVIGDFSEKETCAKNAPVRGDLITTSKTLINGKNEIDLTDYIKEKINNGENIVSLYLVSSNSNQINITAKDTRVNVPTLDFSIDVVHAPDVVNVEISESNGKLTGSYVYKSEIQEDTPKLKTRWLYKSELESEPIVRVENVNEYSVTQDDINGYIIYEVICTDILGNESIARISEPYVLPFAPEVLNANVSGIETYEVGKKIICNYEYYDENGDDENGTMYKVLVSSDKSTWTEAVGEYTVDLDKITYTLIQDDLGKYIKFEIIPMNDTVPNTGETYSSNIVLLKNANPVVSEVTVEGKSEFDATLSASYKYTDDNNDTLSSEEYQWYNTDSNGGDRTKIEGANSETYKITENDFDKYIVCEVTVTDIYGNKSNSKSSEPFKAPTLPKATNVKITGKANVGEILIGTYKVSDEYNRVEEGSTYQWYTLSNNTYTPINGETNPTIVVSSSFSGEQLVFEVVPKTEGASNNIGLPVKSSPVKVQGASDSGSGGGSSGGGNGGGFIGDIFTKPNNTQNNNSNQSSNTNNSVFTDIENHWAKDNILKAYERKYVNGKSENLFDPDSSITRAEVAAIMCRVFGLTNLNSDIEFSDVADTSWYKEYIDMVSCNGIMVGSNGLFRPDDFITRQEFVKTIVNALEKGGISLNATSLDGFVDAQQVSDWAVDSMQKVVAKGVIEGNNSMLNPLNTTTRAEAVTILIRAIGD